MRVGSNAWRSAIVLVVLMAALQHSHCEHMADISGGELDMADEVAVLGTRKVVMGVTFLEKKETLKAQPLKQKAKLTKQAEGKAEKKGAVKGTAKKTKEQPQKQKGKAEKKRTAKKMKKAQPQKQKGKAEKKGAEQAQPKKQNAKRSKKQTNGKSGLRKLKKQLAAAQKRTDKARAKAEKAAASDKALKKEFGRKVVRAEKKASRAKKALSKTPSSKKTKNLPKQIKRVTNRLSKLQSKGAGITASLVKLRRTKETADERFGKAKRKHALSTTGSSKGHQKKANYDMLRAAAKALNVADMTYMSALKRKKRMKATAIQLSAKLKHLQMKLPSSHASKRTEKLQAKALQTDNKAAKLGMYAMKVTAKEDAKVQRRLRAEEKLASRISKMQARIRRVRNRVLRVKQTAAALKLSAKEKKSKADILKGINANAQAESDAENEDFRVSTLANKLRRVKMSQEAATKKTVTAKSTLKVMHKIDAAAKQEAGVVEKYRANEVKAKKHMHQTVKVGGDRIGKLKQQMTKLIGNG